MSLTRLSDEKLRAKGFTEDNIKTLKELGEVINSTGLTTEEFIDNLDDMNARFLMMRGLSKFGPIITTLFESIGKASSEIFKMPNPEQVFKFFGSFNKFMTSLANNIKNNSENIKNSFKGLFAVLGMFKDIIQFGLTVQMKIFTAFFKTFGVDILKITGTIGNNLATLREKLNHFLNNKLMGNISNIISNATKSIVKYYNENNVLKRTIDNVNNGTKVFIETIKLMVLKVESWINKHQVINRMLQMFGDLLLITIRIVEIAKDKISMAFKEIGKHMAGGMGKGISEGFTNLMRTIYNYINTLIQKVKEQLGIHSPSLVFKAIGGNMMDGLLLGIMAVYNTLMNYLTKAQEALKRALPNVDWDLVYSITGLLIMVKIVTSSLNKFLDLAGFIFKPLVLIRDLIGSIVGLFDSMGKATIMKAKAESFRIYVSSIAILVGLIAAIALISTEDIQKGIVTMALLGGLILALKYIHDKISEGDEFDIKKYLLKGSLFLFVGFLKTMVSMLVKISKLSRAEIEKSIETIIIMAGLIVLMMLGVDKLFDYIGKKSGARKRMFETLVTIYIILHILKKMLKLILKASKIETGLILKGIGTLTLISLFVLGATYMMVLISNMNEKDLFQAIGLITSLTFALVSLFNLVRDASGMSFENVLKGIQIITILSLFIIALVAFMNKFKKFFNSNVEFNIVSLGALAGILYVLIEIIKRTSDIEVTTIINGLIRLSLMVGFFAFAKFLLSKIKGGIDPSTMFSMLLLGVTFGIIGGTIKALKDVDPVVIMRGMVGFTIFSLLVGLVSSIIRNTDTSGTGKLIGIAVSFGALIFALSMMNDVNTKQLVPSLMMLIPVIFALSILMFTLTKMPDSTGSRIMAIVKKLLPAIFMISLLYTALAILSMLNLNIGGNMVNSLLSLSLLIINISLTMFLMSKLVFISKAVPVKEILALSLKMILITGLLATILKIMSFVGEAPKIDLGNIISIAIGLVAFTLALIPLSLLGPLTVPIIQGLGAILAIVSILGTFALAIGAIFSAFPNLKEIIGVGFDVISFIFEKIGEMIMAVGVGISKGFTKILNEIGSALGNFGLKIKAFMDLISSSKVDKGVIDSIVTIILGLIAGSFLFSIVSFFNQGNNKLFDDLADALVSFMGKITPFLYFLSGINPQTGKMVSVLIDALSNLINASLFSKFFNVKGNIEAVLEVLPSMQEKITDFINKFANIDQAHVNKVEMVMKIMTMIFNIAKQAPNEGGMTEWINGKSTFEKFIDSEKGPLIKMRDSLIKFIETFTNNEAFNNKNFDTNINKMNQMMDIYNKILEIYGRLEKTGGLQQKFTGEKTVNDLQSFVSLLIGFVNNMTIIMTTMSTHPQIFDQKNFENMNKMLDMLRVVIDFGKKMAEIDTNGGTLFNGFSSNAKRGLDFTTQQMAELAPKMASFVNTLNDGEKGIKEISKEKLDTIVSIVNLINTIATVLKNLKGDENSQGKDVAKIFEAYIDSLLAIMGKFKDLDMQYIQDFKTKLMTIIEAFRESSNINNDQLVKVTETFGNIGNTATDKLADAVKGDKAKEKISGAVNEIVNHMNEGINQKSKDVLSKVLELVDNAQKEMITGNGNLDNIKARGNDFVMGFADGIQNSPNYQSVRDRAFNLGKAAVESLKKGIDSNSPSKKTIREGANFGSGFLIGMRRYFSISKQTARDLGRSTVSSLHRSLTGINESTIGRPTIRPIVDLSDLNNRLDKTLDKNYYLDVRSNLGKVDMDITNRNQNNLNNKLISAVNKLEKRLDNINNNTYNINGVTYDDGSNITSAVNTLIQAVKVERKV